MINPIKGHCARSALTGTKVIIAEIIGFAAVTVHAVYQDGSGGDYPIHIGDLTVDSELSPSKETLLSYLAGADENMIRLHKQLEQVRRNRDFLLSLLEEQDA